MKIQDFAADRIGNFTGHPRKPGHVSDEYSLLVILVAQGRIPAQSVNLGVDGPWFVLKSKIQELFSGRPWEFQGAVSYAFI